MQHGTTASLTNINSSRRRRMAKGALIAGITHLVVAVMLIYVAPNSRMVIGLDPRVDSPEEHRRFCSSARPFTDDLAIFAFEFLLLPGWLTVTLGGNIVAMIIRPLSPSLHLVNAAMVVISSGAFATYGAFVAASRHRLFLLGAAVLYLATAYLFTIVMIGFFGFACAG
jgi:hypothetical protein